MNFLYFKEGGCLLVSLAVALRVWKGTKYLNSLMYFFSNGNLIHSVSACFDPP